MAVAAVLFFEIYLFIFYFCYENVSTRDLKNAIVLSFNKHTRPVAPQHASLASSMSTLFTIPPPPESSSSNSLAAKAPEIPDPIMTTCAKVGREGVVRWCWRKGVGFRSQYDFVDSLDGRLAGAFGFGSPGISIV